jgi:hypothetical protein
MLVCDGGSVRGILARVGWLVVAFGCPSPELPEPVDTDPPIPPPLDCASFCDANDTAEGEARCYACRCKNAMDGWLPSPEELQCALGDEIVVYTADAAGALSPVDAELTTCANPSLLYGTCHPGGRLGQLEHGDVSVKWICRRNTFHPDAIDPSIPYDDVGAILYNARNGQSCWYDDVDGTGLAGGNWPNLDLTLPDADPAEVVQFFYQANGVRCARCHDNDPFNLTPYLQSVPWRTGSWVFGPYGVVDLDGGTRSVRARSLVSPIAGRAPKATVRRSRWEAAIRKAESSAAQARNGPK